MAYKPLSQTVTDNEVFANPSSEAVFELSKEKADVDLQNLSISGTNGQVLTLSGGVPVWADSSGGGGASLPSQVGNSGKYLTTDGSTASWGSITGFEPTLSKGNLTESTSSVLTITGGTGSVIGSGASIQVKQASSSQSGYLSSTDWSTFNSKQSSLSFGDLTESTSSVLTISGGSGAVIGSGASIQVKQSSSTVSGFLSSADWSTFNSKQSAITGAASTITSSDLTASKVLVSDGSGKVSASSVSSTTLGYLDIGSSLTSLLSEKEPTLTKGNLTESTSSVLTITGGTGSVIGSGTSIQVKQASGSQSGFLSSADWTTFNGKQASGNYVTALTGDVTASGPGSASATVAVVGNTSISKATVNTTDATVTTLQTIATFTDTMSGIEVKVAARRTGGAAGAANDSAYFVLHGMAKNSGGTVTLSTVVSSEFEDQLAWNADLVVSGTNILVRVTGAASNNISWKSSAQVISI